MGTLQTAEYKQYHLPKYQFTAYYVRTKAAFIAYEREKALKNVVPCPLNYQDFDERLPLCKGLQ